MDAIEDGGAENADEIVPEEMSADVDQSSGERGGKYKDGDIVWVKLSYCWWPGEVKDIPTDGAFKKPPLYIVKFFEENFFEYVRNEANIFAYQCEKKVDFIKKGLSSNKIKEKLEKFKSDIILAESKTNGNIDILNDPQVQPEKKVNYVAEVFGTAAQRRAASASPKKKGRKSLHKSNSQSHITHRRFLGWDDFESLEMIQYVGKDRKPASDDDEMQQLNSDPEEQYHCAPCNFTCHRLEIFRLHSNQHLKGIIDNKGKQKRPYHKKARKTPATPSTAATSSLDSDDEGSSKKKRRRSKKAEKKDEVEERKRDIAKDLLTEWNEDDDEDLEDILNASGEQQQMNKCNDTSEEKAEDNEDKADDSTEKSEREIVKPAKERSKEQNKSCFDFDDDETNDAVTVSPSGSRKIPRVIPEVRKSTESATNGESSNNNKDSESEDATAAFNELMESTAVPELPDVGASSLLKAEQNFHSGKTIKFPDKSADEPPKSVATKLTNPKKRFVKSFEDFEQYMNEQRRREEEKNLKSNNSGTTMAPAAIADVNDTAGECDDGKTAVATAAVVATNTNAMDTSAKSAQKKVEERPTRRSSRLSRPFKEEEVVHVEETEPEPEPPLDPFDELLRSSELEKRKMAGKSRGKKSAKNLDGSDSKKPKLSEEQPDKKSGNEEINKNSKRSKKGKKWRKHQPKVKKIQEENNQLPENANENADSGNQNIDDSKIADIDENQKELDNKEDKSEDQSKYDKPAQEKIDTPEPEKQIKSPERKNDIPLENNPEKEIENTETDNEIPKFSKDSFVFTYKTRRSNFLKNQSESSSKIEPVEVKEKKIDQPKEKKVHPIMEKEKASRRYSARLSNTSDNSDSSDIDKKLEKVLKSNETKVDAKKNEPKKKSPEKDSLLMLETTVDDDAVDINQLKSNIALKIREAAESVPSKRLGTQHRTPRSKFLESYRQEGLNNEPVHEREKKLDNETKTTLTTPLITPATGATTTSSSVSSATLTYIKKDNYLAKKNIWSSKARYQSPRRENYDDGSKPRENKFFTSRRPAAPPVEVKPEVKEESAEVTDTKSTTNEVVEAEEPVKQPEKLEFKRMLTSLRKSIEKSPKRDANPMQSPRREESPKKIEFTPSPKQSPKKESIGLQSPRKEVVGLQSPKANDSLDNPKSPQKKDAPVVESPKTEIKLPENTCKDAFDFPQTQADLPDDFISKPKPASPKPVVEEKTSSEKEDMYDDLIIDPSKKIPPIDESAILNIETNATVVSEKDLADGQVEIAAISASKPVTLMNFSMDYAETKKEPEVPANVPEVVPKAVVKPPQTVLNQLVTAPFIKDPIGAEKRLGSGQKLITPARTVAKTTIALSKSIPVVKSTIAKPIQIPKTITLSKSTSSIITKPAVTPQKIATPIIAEKSKLQNALEEKPKEVIKEKPKEVIKEKSKEVIKEKPKEAIKEKLKEVIKEKPKEVIKVAKPLPKNDDICDFEDHIPSQIVNKEQPKPVEEPAEEETKPKPIILSEKVVKPGKRNINEVEVVVKGNKKIALDDGGQKGKPKAKILQQTIITPAGEIISGAGGSSAHAAIVDEFDINSMPIVLSDEILTPESIEKMSMVLDSAPAASAPAVKKAVPRILNKSAPSVTLPLISKNVPMQRQKVYTTAISSGNKIIKTTQPIISQKGNKYIVVQGSASGASSIASPLTPAQKIVKKPMVIRKPMPSPLSESKGNKVMIVTNQQGQQQRLLLTPAQQKMIGYQSPAIDKTKLTLQKMSPLARSNAPAKLEGGTIIKNSSSLKTVAQPMKINKSIVGKKIVVQNQSLYPADVNTTQSVQKQLLQQQQVKVDSPAPVVKKQKTILIKNQHGQLVKKIQGTDDALLDKQVAEQIEAIKATSAAALAAQNRAKEAAQLTIPKKQIRRPVPKKIPAAPTVTAPSTPAAPTTALPPALSPIKQQSVPAEEMVAAKPAEESPAPKPDRPLNQLVIQDAMGIQTTITEGQILALPSETVGGQPQSYMLVTLDESGNLTPLNNEALMSLDPNLVPGGDLSNMVLQIDQSGIQQAVNESVPVPEGNVETVVTTSETPATVAEVPPPPPPAVVEEQINAPVSTAPVDIPPPPTAVADELANQVVGGQQLILTGDPEATQKFLESLSNNADLSNILANAEGSILIQADGQQILINTNTVPADAQQQQLMLNVSNEGSTAEGAGNPVFSGQQQQQNKFQDILAAALADTDFQEPNAQNKPSQLSPGGGSMYPLVPNVLDTTLALNSPIMTPLEVPSSNNKKITDEEADILTQPLPKNIDLPITITDPNISQTVMAQQQQQQVANFSNELQELAMPISTAAATVVSAENDKSITTESFGYSLPTLDEIQKPLSSMPLLTDEEEVAAVSAAEIASACITSAPVDESQSFLTSSAPATASAPTTGRADVEEEEGLCTLGGEMCSSLSEPPPEMFELQTRFDDESLKYSNGDTSGTNTTTATSNTDLGVVNSEENSNSTRSEAESSTSCEIPLQPEIETVPANIEGNSTDVGASNNSSSSDAKFD